MAEDPGSTWAPLREAGAPDGLTKDKFIVHSTGTRASASANRNYFERGDVVVESTFIVGLTSDDPTLQIMDSTDNADANGAANRSGISVEVVGLAGDPYTEWQVSELIRLGRWAKTTHRIPAQVIPRPDGAGYGWHVMFGAPGPWTSVVGKECPGRPRIAALTNRIFPAIFAETPTTPTTQEDCTVDQNLLTKQLDQTADAIREGNAQAALTNTKLDQTADAIRENTAAVRELIAKLAS